MSDKDQVMVVESEAVAAALNVRYVPPVKKMPVDFSLFAPATLVTWLDNPDG